MLISIIARFHEREDASFTARKRIHVFRNSPMLIGIIARFHEREDASFAARKRIRVFRDSPMLIGIIAIVSRKRRCVFRGAKENTRLSQLANANGHYSYNITKEKMHLSRREREYASSATRYHWTPRAAHFETRALCSLRVLQFESRPISDGNGAT